MIPQQSITEANRQHARAILDEAQEKLSKILGPEARIYYRILATASKKKKQRMVKIKEVVFVHLGIPIELAAQKSRGKQPVADARMIAIQIIREVYALGSLNEVGSLFGRDHSTVRHACKKVRELILSNHAFASKYLSVRNAVKLIEGTP